MTDADVIAINERYADEDYAFDLVGDAIFSIEFDALSFNDSAGLADGIIDDIITVLRRARPNHRNLDDTQFGKATCNAEN